MKSPLLWLALLVGGISSLSVLAQPGILQQQQSAVGTPTYLRFAPGAARSLAQAPATLRTLLNLTPADELRQTRTETDELGFTHERYKQYYRGGVCRVRSLLGAAASTPR